MQSYSFNKETGSLFLEQALLSNRIYKIPKEHLTLKQEGMLEGILKFLGLNIKDINIKINEDQITLRGHCHSRFDAETAILLMGNIRGIIKVVNLLEGSLELSPQFYEIKEGDTLSKIALVHLNDSLLYNEIFIANKNILQDPTNIIPGFKIRIPQIIINSKS